MALIRCLCFVVAEAERFDIGFVGIVCVEKFNIGFRGVDLC